MKSLKTLMRVKQREIDTIKTEQSKLQDQRDALLAQAAALEQDLENELSAASAMPDMSHVFGQFATHIRKQQERLHHQARQLDAKIAQLADIIRIAFSELKKYDIAYQDWQKREAEKAKQRETKALDEMAIMAHARKYAE
jgi:flagellar export protein FliJ